MAINHLSTNSSGFSLLEILIATALTSILIIAGTALFVSTIIGGGRANTTALVKNNGDYALSQIEFLLRNATELLPIDPLNPNSACQSGMSSIRFRSIDEGVTEILAENQKIASNSGIYLTSDAVELTSGPTFDCYRTADQAITSITVTFGLKRGDLATNRVSEVLEQEFSTTVSLRKSQ